MADGDEAELAVDWLDFGMGRRMISLGSWISVVVKRTINSGAAPRLFGPR